MKAEEHQINHEPSKVIVPRRSSLGAKSHKLVTTVLHTIETAGACPKPTSGSSDATNSQDNDNNNDDTKFQYYTDFPLLQSMMRHETTRNRALQHEGRKQISCPKSNDGWIKTLFIVQGRALDWIWFPFSISMVHVTVYTLLQELVFNEGDREYNNASENWHSFFGFVLNATLAFLLVFRLNRAAERYWVARGFWGSVVASTRTMCAGILVHGSSTSTSTANNHNSSNNNNNKNHHFHRDEAVRWLAALPLTIMEFVRGLDQHDTAPSEIYAGILAQDELRQVFQQNHHPPLFVASQVRHCLKALFGVTAEMPLALATSHTQVLDRLEAQLNLVLDACGGMERIRGTPLPMVYVSHLRTFLLLNLLLFPYVWGPDWGWGTIPIVGLASFALLGIEASAAEVECPFRKDRVNALNMDGYCQTVLSNILQELKSHADREIMLQRRKHDQEYTDGMVA